jgi:hypothetical protein
VSAQEPKNQTPVIVAVKDLGDVDNDYFLIPVRNPYAEDCDASAPIYNLPAAVLTLAPDEGS